MTDIHETLKTVLERDCAVTAYFRNLPANPFTIATSYIKFQRISHSEVSSHSGRMKFFRDRFTVWVVGKTREDMLALKELMEVSLYHNNSDFKLCQPLDFSRDDMLSNSYSKDFYIFYEGE
jgi:hypothetical protein